MKDVNMIVGREVYTINTGEHMDSLEFHPFETSMNMCMRYLDLLLCHGYYLIVNISDDRTELFIENYNDYRE